MNACPHCEIALTESERTRETCPNCDEPLHGPTRAEQRHRQHWARRVGWAMVMAGIGVLAIGILPILKANARGDDSVNLNTRLLHIGFVTLTIGAGWVLLGDRLEGWFPEPDEPIRVRHIAGLLAMLAVVGALWWGLTGLLAWLGLQPLESPP